MDLTDESRQATHACAPAEAALCGVWLACREDGASGGEDQRVRTLEGGPDAALAAGGWLGGHDERGWEEGEICA